MERCTFLSDQLAALTKNFLETKEILLQSIATINELKSRLKKMSQEDAQKGELIEILLLELEALQKRLSEKVSALNHIHKMVIFIQDELERVKRAMQQGEDVIHAQTGEINSLRSENGVLRQEFMQLETHMDEVV